MGGNMMRGVTDQLWYLNKELRDLLTASFKNELENACKNFNKVTNDQNITQLIIGLNDALSKYSNIDDLIEKCNSILESIDHKTIGDTIEQIKKILNKANDIGLIDKICSTLNDAKSISQLASTATELILPMKVVLYGATGALVGMTILKTIEIYLARRQDEELNKLVQLSTQHLLVSIAQLRMQASETIMQYHYYKKNEVDFEQDTNIIEISIEEARNILKNTSPIGIESLEIMNIIQKNIEQILHHLYQERLADEEVDIVLDRACSIPIDWDAVVNYASYYGSYFDKSPKPTIDRSKLNYALVRKLYEEKHNQIQAIMEKLSDQFTKHGGDDLYYSISSQWADSVELFIRITSQIPLLANNTTNIDYAALGLQQWQQSIESILRVYRAANDYITEQWQGSQSSGKSLSEEVCQLILFRAYSEFCKQTAKYFFAPYNLSREIINGGKDMICGYWNMVRHPIATAQEIVFAPVTLLTKRNEIYSAIKAHPTRMASSIAFNTITPWAATKICNNLAAISSGANISTAAATTSASTPTASAARTMRTMVKGINHTKGLPARISRIRRIESAASYTAKPLQTITTTIANNTAKISKMATASTVTIATSNIFTSQCIAMTTDNINATDEDNAIQRLSWDQITNMMTKAKNMGDFYNLLYRHTKPEEITLEAISETENIMSFS